MKYLIVFLFFLVSCGYQSEEKNYIYYKNDSTNKYKVSFSLAVPFNDVISTTNNSFVYKFQEGKAAIFTISNLDPKVTNISAIIFDEDTYVNY